MITLMREITLNHHGDNMRVGQTCLIPVHVRNVVKLKKVHKKSQIRCS